LNDQRFDPAKTAILEFDPNLPVTASDSSASAKVVLFEPDRIVIEAQNQHGSLMVLSEIYYPKGWGATVDGNETEIFKTNHILRSVWVPGGKHEIEFSFRPATYFRNARISRYATWMVYLLLLVELGRRFGPTRGRKLLAAVKSKGE
ncbi:YfhO family protein, partial [bacterium]|nr:YfhO family protein [bacterium]